MLILITYSPVFALSSYSSMFTYIPVKYMTMLCKALLTAIKRNSENGNDNNSGSEVMIRYTQTGDSKNIFHPQLMLRFKFRILIDSDLAKVNGNFRFKSQQQA